MKNIILTFCIFVTTVHAEFTIVNRHKYFDDCLEENNLSKDDFHRMVITKDPKAGCIHACYMEKLDEMVDGEFDENKIVVSMFHAIHKHGKEAITKLISFCKAEADTGLNKCEKAMKMKTCMHRETWKLNYDLVLLRQHNFQLCVKEAGLTLEQFHVLKKAKDPKAGCVIACAMEKNEELADGKLVIKNILMNLPKDLVWKLGKNQTQELLTNCSKEAESAADKCEKAMAMKNCKHREFFKVKNTKRELNNQFTSCLVQHGVTKLEKLEELKNANDPKIGDIMLCAMEKSGEIKDGKIDKERMLEVTSPTHYMKIGRDKYMEIIDACVAKGEGIANKSEMVLSVKDCIRKNKVEAEINEGPKTK